MTTTFTFPVGFLDSFGELSQFSLLSGTSSILRTFLGGTSEKKSPCISNLVCHDPTSAVPWTEIGNESDVTSAVQNEIVISDCSPLEIVDIRWVLNEKYQ